MTDPFRPPTGGVLAPTVAVLALLLAAGSGYLALDASSQHTQLVQERDRLRQTVSGLQKENVELEKQSESLASSLQDAHRNKEQAESHAQELQLRLNDKESELSTLTAKRPEVIEELRELQALSTQFQRLLDAGTLDVVSRRGRIVIRMPAAALFPAQSAELSDAGAQVLRRVADVLKGHPTRRFTIGGHTDNVPSKNERYDSNWAFSAARAAAVTQRLVRAGMRASQLASAGFASFDPLASNRTKQGRAQNRRLEIVLEPYVSKLPPAGLEQELRAGKRQTKKRTTRAKRRGKARRNKGGARGARRSARGKKK